MVVSAAANVPPEEIKAVEKASAQNSADDEAKTTAGPRPEAEAESPDTAAENAAVEIAYFFAETDICPRS